jgi:hypothetical protein
MHGVKQSGKEDWAMRCYINIYAQTFMVATRMDPLLSREFRVSRTGAGWLSRLVRWPAGCTDR